MRKHLRAAAAVVAVAAALSSCGDGAPASSSDASVIGPPATTGIPATAGATTTATSTIEHDGPLDPETVAKHVYGSTGRYWVELAPEGIDQTLVAADWAALFDAADREGLGRIGIPIFVPTLVPAWTKLVPDPATGSMIPVFAPHGVYYQIAWELYTPDHPRGTSNPTGVVTIEAHRYRKEDLTAPFYPTGEDATLQGTIVQSGIDGRRYRLGFHLDADEDLNPERACPDFDPASAAHPAAGAVSLGWEQPDPRDDAFVIHYWILLTPAPACTPFGGAGPDDLIRFADALEPLT